MKMSVDRSLSKRVVVGGDDGILMKELAILAAKIWNIMRESSMSMISDMKVVKRNDRRAMSVVIYSTP